MIDLPDNAIILASHTMLNLISGGLRTAILWSIAPILIAAFIGARFRLAPFHWRRLAGVVFGVMIVLVAVSPSVVLSYLTVRFCYSTLGFRLGGYGDVVGIVLIYLISATVAYVASIVGRPAFQESLMTMDALNGNLRQIEAIVGAKLLDVGKPVPSEIGIDIDQIEIVLSPTQQERLAQILQSRDRLLQSGTALHSEVDFWARRSSDLLAEILSDHAAKDESMIAMDATENRSLDNGNPYMPPASGA
jgi:hypothetical protein